MKKDSTEFWWSYVYEGGYISKPSQFKQFNSSGEPATNHPAYGDEDDTNTTFITNPGGDNCSLGLSISVGQQMINGNGENVKEALPSMPIEVLGFDANPLAGDDFVVVDNENSARKIAEYRFNKKQIQKNKVIKTNVEEMFKKISAGEVISLPVIIKADVQGSAEAIESSIIKLSTDEVKTNIINKGVGAITESDVALANSSKGFIVGFNVRAIPQARDMAKQEGVDIKYYSIIYELIDDIKNLLSGLLKPNITENITGNVEIREIFSISKIGNIAGCFVKEGLISRNSKIRILRDNIVIHNGTISSLKRFKDEVKEVKAGYECGIIIENYSDIKVNDIIETFEVVETSRKL
jgi:translation initiation factor IF-2